MTAMPATKSLSWGSCAKTLLAAIRSARPCSTDMRDKLKDDERQAALRRHVSWMGSASCLLFGRPGTLRPRRGAQHHRRPPRFRRQHWLLQKQDGRCCEAAIGFVSQLALRLSPPLVLLTADARLKPTTPLACLHYPHPRLALKVSDEFTVPLCAIHHSENHATGDERRWWQERKIDPLAVGGSTLER